ncbi:MAG: hypothetical protein GTO14_04185 [Anaerolineales bacterium]|nr:hypothetical protein [Anaerolineales bacterium]
MIPGILLVVWKIIQQRAWSRAAPLIWVIVFLAVYAWRLPVTYQHGRYVMPVMAVVFILGLEGMFGWVKPRSTSTGLRVLSQAWIGVVPVVATVFLVLRGFQAYAQDVAFIETEMVRTSRWIAVNTEPDAIIATHDIGALGYFGERAMLDLAGLVSPQVIPIIRDESAIASYLDSEGANYLMTFPNWYPQLVLLAEPVYVTGAEFSPLLGGENMTVYRWSSGGLPHE